MTARTIHRVLQVIFAIASIGFLLETLAEKDGPSVEIFLAAAMVVAAAAWLGWGYLAKHRLRG